MQSAECKVFSEIRIPNSDVRKKSEARRTNFLKEVVNELRSPPGMKEGQDREQEQEQEAFSEEIAKGTKESSQRGRSVRCHSHIRANSVDCPLT